MTSRTQAPTLTLPVGPRDHAQGPESAPLTLVEYGDYECPHCGRAYPIVQAVQKHLGAKLRFVFRNFPLTESHPHAENAALAAETAAKFGKFWEMHDALFENQRSLEPADLLSYAKTIGLDVSKFSKAFKSPSLVERVREDFMSGVRSGVNGTPTFFIGGVRYDGSWNLPDLLPALEAALIKK